MYPRQCSCDWYRVRSCIQGRIWASAGVYRS